jgi:hypothetical protein
VRRVAQCQLTGARALKPAAAIRMRAGQRSYRIDDPSTDEVVRGRRADRQNRKSFKAGKVEKIERYSHASSHGVQPYTVGHSIRLPLIGSQIVGRLCAPTPRDTCRFQKGEPPKSQTEHSMPSPLESVAALRYRQPRRTAASDRQAFGIARHHLRRPPPAGLHDRRQLDAGGDHVLGDADPR